MNSYEVNSEKLGNVGSRHGSRDSREYQKLAVSLAAAENKQKKLEENIRNLRSMQNDMQRDLKNATNEVNLLRKVQHSMLQPSFKETRDLSSLYVSQLDYETKEKDLELYFQRFGSIQNVRIIRYPITRFSRGFGFVEFTQSFMADAALSCKPHRINGKKIEVCLAKLDKMKANRFRPY